jgi:glutamyl-tRNA synthetase/nondiscriminating glutamyl-tRNA synthetase
MGQRVIGAFAARAIAEPGPITAERFKALMNEVKAETGAKGKELFHPVRIVLTGAHSGPEFDKIIPLFEDGAALKLGVKSVAERAAAFF